MIDLVLKIRLGVEFCWEQEARIAGDRRASVLLVEMQAKSISLTACSRDWSNAIIFSFFFLSPLPCLHLPDISDRPGKTGFGIWWS